MALHSSLPLHLSPMLLPGLCLVVLTYLSCSKSICCTSGRSILNSQAWESDCLRVHLYTFTGCVTLDRLLNLFEPPFPDL